MKAEVSDIRYSPTGKRMDGKVTFEIGDGFFSPIIKGHFNFFAMGSEAAISALEGQELAIAKEVVAQRESWLSNPGKIFYNYNLQDSGTLIRIRKTKYVEDDA